MIGPGEAVGHDVSRVGYCVCLLLVLLPHRDAPAEAARFPSARYGLFRRKIMVGKNAWAPPCGARTRAGGSCLARVVIGPEGPRSRCRMHGGHLLSGKQTVEGRKRIADAVRKRMLAFWSDWRKQGRPALPWRESLRTARTKPKKPPPPPKPPVRKILLTEEEKAFGRKIGLLKAA